MYSVGAAGFASSLLLRSVGPFTEPAYLFVGALTGTPTCVGDSPGRLDGSIFAIRLPRRLLPLSWSAPQCPGPEVRVPVLECPGFLLPKFAKPELSVPTLLKPELDVSWVWALAPKRQSPQF